MQYYLHNFLTEQPDLNFHNPEVQDALLDVARFWLERGVDGFRLDTINFYFHEPGTARQSAAAARASATTRRRRRSIPTTTRTISTTRAGRKTSTSSSASARCSTNIRRPPPSARSATAQRGLEIVGDYTAGGDKMHMCYAFDFLAPETLTPRKRRGRAWRTFGAVASDGWACWAFSNHDVMRHVTRWGAGVADRDGLSQGASRRC